MRLFLGLALTCWFAAFVLLPLALTQTNKSIPEMQDVTPSPLPFRPSSIPMQHRRYSKMLDTNAWFILTLGSKDRIVYGVEPHETVVTTTIMPLVTYSNGNWIIKF